MNAIPFDLTWFSLVASLTQISLVLFSKFSNLVGNRLRLGRGVGDTSMYDVRWVKEDVRCMMVDG